MNFFLLLLLNALALLLIAYLIPGFSVRSFWTAVFAAIILGLVNMLIRPFILLLTLPINILTLGLFSLVINGLMLWLVAKIVPGFRIDSFGVAIMAALLLWGISWLTNGLIQA